MTQIPLVLSVCWFVVFAGLASSISPLGVLGRRSTRPGLTAALSTTVRPAPGTAVADFASTLGRWCRRRLRRPPHAASDRRFGTVLLVAVPCLPIDFRLAAIASIVAAIRPVLADRRKKRTRDVEVLRELPEVVDLFTVAVRGGLTMPLAVAAVGDRLIGHVADALRMTAEQARLGRRLSDELERLPDELGDSVRPLVRALVAADRYGVPIADSLERLAVDVRIERRRAAEIIARRIPVKLLFPLVFCVLPSFALLTLAPVLASSLESLR